jgi:ribosomal protein S18 acetylase RimI-like enzyme
MPGIQVALEAIFPANFSRRIELIRIATPTDVEGILQVIEPVFRAGETYTIPQDISSQEALAYWFADPHEVFVYEDSSGILGTYFLQANQQGNGAHVANCGYITAAQASGRGIARAMCQHSLARAKERGFRAMQFNFVVSTNERAVKLWQSLGFAIVGQLPKAFSHPRLGFVDAFVMFREII